MQAGRENEERINREKYREGGRDKQGETQTGRERLTGRLVGRVAYRKGD